MKGSNQTNEEQRKAKTNNMSYKTRETVDMAMPWKSVSRPLRQPYFVSQ